MEPTDGIQPSTSGVRNLRSVRLSYVGVDGEADGNRTRDLQHGKLMFYQHELPPRESKMVGQAGLEPAPLMNGRGGRI